MEETINELIEIIKTMNSRDGWDYVEIFAPLILSIVAIGISIWTAFRQNQIGERQNNIALFEPRYNTFNILNFLLPVARAISENSKQKDAKFNTWDILASSMQTYKYSTSPFDVNVDYRQLQYFYTNLILECGRLPCLFKKENTRQITAFLETFNDIVSNVCNGEQLDKKMVLLELLNMLSMTSTHKLLIK